MGLPIGGVALIVKVGHFVHAATTCKDSGGMVVVTKFTV